MKTELSKINKIKRTSGTILVHAGNKMIADSFQISPHKLSSSSLSDFMEKQILDYSKKSFSYQDGQYYLIDWDTYRQIIEVDWTDELEYITNRHDCENFAHGFQNRMSELFGINSVFSVHGHIYSKTTGKWVGGHIYNAIPTKEKDGLHLYWFEPMHDLWVENKKNEPIIMGKYIYTALSFRCG